MTMTRWWSSMDKLNDEELILVFIRLPVNCVHRNKCVSKRWLAIISDPYFIRNYIQFRQNLSHHDHFILHASHLAQFIPLPLPYDHQLLESESESKPTHKMLDFSLSFLPIIQNYPRNHTFGYKYILNNLKIVGSSHGLLLCMAHFKKKQDTFFGYRSRRAYYVCNPLTKQWLVLPLLHRRYTYAIAIEGFMCHSLDPLSSKVEFTVLEVEAKYDAAKNYFHTHVFSSETGTWTNFVVACPPSLKWKHYFRPPVVCNGIFHWCFDLRGIIVAYDPINEPSNCRIINPPPPVTMPDQRPPEIELSEGHIRIISHSSKIGFFDVWELTDYDKCIWDLKYQVEYPTSEHFTCLLSQTNGEIAYLMHWFNKKVILFNMKYGSQQRAVEIPKARKSVVVTFAGAQPFVMTLWPTSIPQLTHNDQDD